MQWSAVPFYGTVATLAGDVQGSGAADLIAVDTNAVWVLQPNGNTFQPTEWFSSAFFGSLRIRRWYSGCL